MVSGNADLQRACAAYYLAWDDGVAGDDHPASFSPDVQRMRPLAYDSRDNTFQLDGKPLKFREPRSPGFFQAVVEAIPQALRDKFPSWEDCRAVPVAMAGEPGELIVRSLHPRGQKLFSGDLAICVLGPIDIVMHGDGMVEIGKVTLFPGDIFASVFATNGTTYGAHLSQQNPGPLARGKLLWMSMKAAQNK